MEVCWSPVHQDKFYQLGTNLTFYKVYDFSQKNNFVNLEDKVSRLSENTGVTLLCTQNDFQFKRVAWRPDSSIDNLLAIGDNQGKIHLTSFGKNVTEERSLVNKSFNLRHPRACLDLQWNPNLSNLLAEVTEKQKQEPCIIIWDVIKSQSSSSSSSSSSKATNYSSDTLSHSHIAAEIGSNDSCSCFSWMFSSPHTFLSGINSKAIRLFDIREPSKWQQQVLTKILSLIAVDPKFDYRVASSSENSLYLWDIRKFKEPIEAILEVDSFLKLDWCPTKSGLLASSFIDSPIIKLYDFSYSKNSNQSSSNDFENPFKIERLFKPINLGGLESGFISSFSWHPTHKTRLLATTPGGILADFQALDRVSMNWSPGLTLTLANGSCLLLFDHESCKELEADVSFKIRRRALNQYGVKPKVAENIELVADDEELRRVWSWISVMKPEHHFEEPQASTPSEPFAFPSSTTPNRNPTFIGYHPDIATDPQKKNFILTQPSLTQSPTLPQNLHQLNTPVNNAASLWTPLEGIHSLFLRSRCSTPINLEWMMNTSNQNLPSSSGSVFSSFKNRWQVFKSSERTQAIDMCGWKFGHESMSLPIIDRLESEQQYTRAATISIFTVRMMRAIELLKKGGQNQQTKSRKNQELSGDLNIVAMALSGFSGNQEGFWVDMCSQLNPLLKNHYLKALFSFLSSNDTGYESIVNDSKLELTDRIAFACMHLHDTKLQIFLEKETNKHIEEGKPVGLILTGFNENGVKLLSNYVDRTGDVQSAVCLLIQALPQVDPFKWPQVRGWVEEYRNLLDRMQLWLPRAEFDVFYKKFEKAQESRQIFISCTFCNKPIVSDNRAKRSTSNFISHVKPRIQSCPHCRKPLPRCSVCMLFMGTAAGIGCPKSTKNALKSEKKLTKINDWFTWCQSCLHGGHADHMLAWFQIKSVCPVSGCKCLCEQLDPISKINIDPRSQETS